MRLRYHWATHVGNVREHNEDRHLAQNPPALFAVADGMGGHAAGEVAAELAISHLRRRARVALDVPHFDPRAFFERTFSQANEIIHAAGERHPEQRGMGTTLTALHVREFDRDVEGFPAGLYALVGHAGDSRCYLVRRGPNIGSDYEGRQLTVDQSKGNFLLNCLGGRPDWYKGVDVTHERLFPGDMLVLASDGLNYGAQAAGAVARMRGALSSRQFTEALVQSALDGGGHDNVTVVVVEIAE